MNGALAWLCRDYGAPGRSRTYNPQIRSLMLYPLSYGRTLLGVARKELLKKYTGQRWYSQGDHSLPLGDAAIVQ
jgi:hypothetical protein